MYPPTNDSVALAQREARLRAFLEEQAAESASNAAVDRRLMEPVVVATPTVVVFRPGILAIPDRHPLQDRMKAAVDSAKVPGWEVTERSTLALRIVDATTQAMYTAPVARDSVGVAMIAPGYPPQVHYGLEALQHLGARVRAFEAWLRKQASPSPART